MYLQMLSGIDWTPWWWQAIGQGRDSYNSEERGFRSYRLGSGLVLPNINIYKVAKLLI